MMSTSSISIWNTIIETLSWIAWTESSFSYSFSSSIASSMIYSSYNSLATSFWCSRMDKIDKMSLTVKVILQFSRWTFMVFKDLGFTSLSYWTDSIIIRILGRFMMFRRAEAFSAYCRRFRSFRCIFRTEVVLLVVDSLVLFDKERLASLGFLKFVSISMKQFKENT